MSSNKQEKRMDLALILKYIKQTANAEEHKLVDLWCKADKTNEETLLRVAKVYHTLQTQQRIRNRNPHQALAKVHQRIKRNSRRVFIHKLAVAASLLIGISGIGLFMLYYGQTPPLQMITISTNAGMRSQLTLSDGTRVDLNAGSTLIYPSQYDSKERRVQLSGEAYFKVTHNKDQPFVVSTAGGKVHIQVLGTEFNLQAYEQDSLVQTTLTEGSVEIQIQGRKDKKMLTSSERLTYDIKTDELYQEKINTEPVTAWKNGWLVFKDTPMPEVLRTLTHFYSVEFDVRDNIISGYSFTGTFENRPLFQILDYMKISSKIDYIMVYPENQDVRKPVISLSNIK